MVAHAIQHSAIYEGVVRHRRFFPTPHQLRLPLYMMYLDLAELPFVFERRWLWSTTRPALARFLRRDYLGDPAVELGEAVRTLVDARTGKRPSGPIRLLTHLRQFGYVFNPVSFYYCFDASGSRVEFVVAEITNTPWKERHAYVLEVADAATHGRAWEWSFAKQFHVSPFNPMNQSYAWRLGAPDDKLYVHMENQSDQSGSTIFDATLSLTRTPITSASLARMLAVYPALTARVVASIYWHALRLRLKGLPFIPHPKWTSPAPSSDVPSPSTAPSPR